MSSVRDEGDERLPLRDAVEKRPISLIEPGSSFKLIEDAEVIRDEDSFSGLKYYGAAGYLNKIMIILLRRQMLNSITYFLGSSTRNDERLQLGNANLQAMQQTVASPRARRIIVCYMESWAAYRAPPLAFTAGLVPKSCTHLHYAFATMHPHTYSVIPNNEDYDIVKGGYRIATGLKKRLNGLKVMISVGGEGTDRLFSEMVQEPERRSMFIESAVNFMREHDFDGLDLHWVYPGEDENERELLTALLYELREKFSSYGFLLSTVLPPFRYQIEDGYDLSAVSGATDYTVLQAWDMTHGKRDEPPTRAVQHSPLRRDPGAAARDQRYDNIEFMVKFILRHGMNAEKLVLGIPFFGRTYTLASSARSAPGAAVTGWGEEGAYTQTKGLLSYFEICMAEREGKGSSNVDEAGNTYVVFDKEWVTYDTPVTVLEKMKFVVTTGLAGAAAWSIDMDDFRGLCGQPFPLLSAISTTLNGEAILSDQSSLKIGSCESDNPYLASDVDSCAHFHFCTGGISYRMSCEDDRLYDPSTGFCGYPLLKIFCLVPTATKMSQNVCQDKVCAISVEDAARFLSQAYEIDFEWNDPSKDMTANNDPERLIAEIDSKKSKQSDKLVVCYMTSWAFYRRGDGKFVPENIDTRLCTHVVYAYASLSPDELIAKEFDPWADVTNNLYERVTSLKDVKVLLGLGGWTDSAGDKYSRMVSSQASRSKFIEKLIPFLRMHNFKGLHLDWNYPVCWQSNCKKGAVSDKPNFAKFVQELSKALHGAGMELGVAISGYKEVIESAYDLPVLSKAADFLSTMTYDYHGGWEKSTGHHTPLVPASKETLAHYSIEYAIKALISGGADPKKLLLGLSFYGQSYRLNDMNGAKGPGSPAAGPGEPGEFTKQPGMLAYYEVCYRVKNLRWKTGRQDNAGPYTYSDNQWVGYDDPKSITEKVEWALRQGMGGVTAWAIDLDDFSNRCCAEPSPLLRAAGRALGRSVPAPPTAACERPPEPVTPAAPTTTAAESDGKIKASLNTLYCCRICRRQKYRRYIMQCGRLPRSSRAIVKGTCNVKVACGANIAVLQAYTGPPPSTAATWPSFAKCTDEGPQEGDSCIGEQYSSVPGDCNAYLHCDGTSWHMQRCAPGLHWSNVQKHCDWPKYAKCEAPPSGSSLEGSTCGGNDMHAPSTTCDSYLLCVGGRWRKQLCPPGLHWDKRTRRCDWVEFAMCEGLQHRHISRASQASCGGQTAASVTSPPPLHALTSDRATLQSATPPTLQSTMMQQLNEEPPKYCESGTYAQLPSDCTRYLHCLFGKFEEFACSAGLHWNQEKQICDWPKNAKCKPRYKLVCYYTNWSWYRPGIGKYSPEDIDPTLCTHIVYGFAVLGDDGLIMAHDSWSDIDNGFYEKVVEYKRYGIKVSLAIGGWNDSAGDKYSKLVNDPAARARFVSHVVQFLKKYGFDGLDLDWEYPKCWQVDCSKGPDSDKEAFADLVLELSAVFKPKGLLLSAAVSPNKKVIDAGYDVPVLARHLDWIAVMTYDYHGQWDKRTGHVAPLYYHPEDGTTYFNANYTIHYWMKKGAPAHKLIMGMPMYGQTFTLGTEKESPQSLSMNIENTGLNAPASDGGEAGEYTRAKGFLSYYEICDRIRYNGWKVVKDPYQRMGPYAYKDNQWVSFDDVEIIKKKVNFIKSLNLGGGMVWALDLDDFKNRCGQGKHPLVNAIKNGLLDSKVEEDTILSDPIIEPPNEIDEDSDDIQVRPTKKPTPRPTQMTTQWQTTALTTTTKRPVTTVSTNLEDRYKVVCYYTNWAWYRPGPGKFTPSDIDPSLCTHIVYAFAVLDTKRLVIKPHDIWLDVENKFYEKVVSLKQKGVKVVLGIGGWDDSASDKYSRMVNSPSARRKFVIHAVDFIEQYEFDGLNLDWEYPKCWQVNCEKGPSSDKQGFANLVKELRAAFRPRGLTLSAAVSASKRVIDAAYDVATLSKNLDWISLMTYDYHGQWDKKTGHLSPMYASEVDEDKTLNTNFTVNYWINKGASPEKLILGVPFYGQSFSLEENAGSGLGAPSYAGGEAGDETRARGFLSFYEICDRIRMKGWKVSRDPGGRMGPYASFEDQWVSFDDDFMVRHKAEYVRSMGLGGSMAWSLDLDDFSGKNCGCGKSPLLATINHVLRGLEAPPRCPLEELQADTTDTSEVPEIEGPSLEGGSCSGNVFKSDENKCSKYYLCLNGRWMQLECPAPLHWHKNHCDWPEKAQCRTKGGLRIGGIEPEEIEEDKSIVGCYFTNWAFYRPGKGSFGPEQVNPSLCTHIIYAWAHLDGNSFNLVPGNSELDLENDFYGKLTQLRQTGVKIIIGAGGLTDSESRKWSVMVSSPENRKTFVESVLKFLQRWHFDGIQVAWQYPGCRQRDNFANLLSELSRKLRAHDLEISAMVTASPEIAQLAYKPHILASELDWVAIAANDYYASSTGKTSYLVPLQSSHGSNSLNASLSFWTHALPPRHVVLGIPGYGRSYTLRSASNSALGAPVTGPGEPGPYTRVPGLLAYYEIADGLACRQWKESRTSEGTFSVRGGQWASYLNVADVRSIGAAARRAGARGVALWALDLDVRGDCSLLNAMRRGLIEPELPLEQCAPAA
ncbi:hypothetical protein HW555_010092 [Spodoptera exigua]|uniref:Chitinase n=1 Tax=Spodoptera exigua TaxID=7107 RepID=A0A835G7X1_SPOEX|nr:hypothetical protein HW555_010092 [Spodoptera exigua]